MSNPISSLLPQVMPMPGDPDGAMHLNASAVVELMKRYAPDTPQAREFLEAYHAAEVDVAFSQPYLAEAKIRDEAFVLCCQRLGIRLSGMDEGNSRA
jgi:hypothetical protein